VLPLLEWSAATARSDKKALLRLRLASIKTVASLQQQAAAADSAASAVAAAVAAAATLAAADSSPSSDVFRAVNLNEAISLG
jgi:hypothetical protein